MQAALTDFRLYWEALATALTDRDKVIIDAENVPGRRHLWLMPRMPMFRVPGMSAGCDGAARRREGP